MPPHRPKGIRLRPLLLAALGYLIISTAYTWPIVVNLDSKLFGDFGDTRGVVWWLWAQKNGFLDGTTINLISAPWGASGERSFTQPLSEFLLISLAHIFDEIVALNVFVLLSFPLTAVATYLLLERLLHHERAAFIGGFLFGFCPAAILHAAGGHSAFALNAFVPLFLLALFYNRARRTHLTAFLVASAYAAVVLTALYVGYFAIYLAIFFMTYDIASGAREIRRATLVGYLEIFVFATLLIVPFEFRAIYEQVVGNPEHLSKVGRIRDLNELIVYSSRPWEFIIPSIDNPFVGVKSFQFTAPRLRSNAFEQTLYLGAVPLGLFCLGAFLSVRKRSLGDRRFHFIFFLCGACWMYFLSLPPLISIGNAHLPTLSLLAYEIAPMFRVYGRFGILVMFFVACAAAVMLAYLGDQVGPNRSRAVFLVLMPIMVLEFWSVSPGFPRSVEHPPEIYQWLAKEPGDMIVAEYPMVRSDEAAFYTYLFWQRVHGKRLVNGASPGQIPAWEFFERITDLSKSDTVALLKAAGVRYVIVHQQMYEEGPIPQALKRYYPPLRSALKFNDGAAPPIPLSLRLHQAFGSDLVFSVEDSPPREALK